MNYTFKENYEWPDSKLRLKWWKCLGNTPESFALSWKEKQKMVAAMAIWAIVTHSETCSSCASNDHSDTDQTDTVKRFIEMFRRVMRTVQTGLCLEIM